MNDVYNLSKADYEALALNHEAAVPGGGGRFESGFAGAPGLGSISPFTFRYRLIFYLRWWWRGQ